MIELVKVEVKTRHTHLSEAECEERAEIIAQAAVRYYLLKVSPRAAVHFDPVSSIAFTGDTGPYLLYTYARIESILRKSGNPSSPPIDPHPPLSLRERVAVGRVRGGTGGVMSDLEWKLIFQLARFPETITQAAASRDPSHLAQYIYLLAQHFSEFYEQVPVLKAEPSSRAFRLALISAVQAALKQGLRLLTIDTVEEM
jgi:arginyl-tRNA synthetase